METGEIVRRLERWTGRFEGEAVEAAVAGREEITPELLRMIAESVDRAGELSAEGNYTGHLYGMLLLAQFREVRAYPLVVRFASLPGKQLDSLGGDFIKEDLGRVLASVCGGQIDGIQSLIENEDVDPYVRSVALDSLVTLVSAGQRSRKEIVSYFARLFQGKLVRVRNYVWSSLVCCACDLYPKELMDDIERAYADGLIEPFDVGFASVKRDLEEGKNRVLARLADRPGHGFVEDAAIDMARWWGNEDAMGGR